MKFKPFAVLAALSLTATVYATGAAAAAPTTQPAVSKTVAAAPNPQKARYAKALITMKSIPVKGRAPKTGYKRSNFGTAWTDKNTSPLGGNGCDTRNDILKRDLTGEKFGDTKQCKVLSGVLVDKYTNKTITFKYGVGTSSKVQIDHIVPLSLAWQQGAQQWKKEKRVNFANDPRNLRAVDGPTNGSKSDSGPGSWLPPNKSFRCEYVAGFVDAVKLYGLSMNPGDYNASKSILTTCAK